MTLKYIDVPYGCTNYQAIYLAEFSLVFQNQQVLIPFAAMGNSEKFTLEKQENNTTGCEYEKYSRRGFRSERLNKFQKKGSYSVNTLSEKSQVPPRIINKYLQENIRKPIFLVQSFSHYSICLSIFQADLSLTLTLLPTLSDFNFSFSIPPPLLFHYLYLLRNAPLLFSHELNYLHLFTFFLISPFSNFSILSFKVDLFQIIYESNVHIFYLFFV